MTIRDTLVVVRGGGDLATGVIARLFRSGFPVIVTELADPLTVRRTVALSSAVTATTVDVEDFRGRLVTGVDAAIEMARSRESVPVLVHPGLLDAGQQVVVDARLAKRRLDTTIADAPLVVALGPGFTAGVDCHAVVETMRGHHLGRAIWSGPAEPDTGTPGLIAGRAAERVVRAPLDGRVAWQVAIGDVVEEGDQLGHVADAKGATVALRAPFTGLVRGLLRDGREVHAGLKIADVDPRTDLDAIHTISDKALAVGGGVLEAVLAHLARTGTS